MKKLLAMLLVSSVLLLGGLVGCGKGETRRDETRGPSGERLPPHMRLKEPEPKFKGNNPKLR